MLRSFILIVAVVTFVMLAAGLYGCASSYSGNGVLRNFRMVKPLASADPVYEDNDVRVRFRIIDDKRIELNIKNLTSRQARIFWRNSSFAAIDDEEADIGVNLIDIDGRPDPAVTTIDPRDTVTVEVCPAYSEFVDEAGRPDNRPLYVSADGEGQPGDIVGKRIGVNLVMELNGSTRFHRFRMEVTPSPPGEN